MDLLIKEEYLNQVDMTAQELMIEIAIHLYDIGRLSMGQARTLAHIDQLQFQQELMKRNLYLKYEVEDLEEDLRTINIIHQKRNS